MAKLNMVKVSTLFRKGYLLAGVMMAANMLVVNEVKATEEEKNDATLKDVKIEVEDDKGKKKTTQKILDKVLSWENYFNLFGTLALSCANNYFKWWDYNAGSYCNLRIGCLGWRTKKLFDIVQVGINLNLGRGILWLIPGIFGLMQHIKMRTNEYPIILNSTAGLIMLKILKKMKKENNIASSAVFYSIIFLTQGFVSAPLTFNISNFSIAISLDSILWEFVIGKFLEPESNKDVKNKDINNLNNNIEEKMIEMNDFNIEVENNKK